MEDTPNVRSPRDWCFPHRELTEDIIAAAITVHRALGPGYVESIYEKALVIQLRKQGHEVQRQVVFPVCYDGQKVGEHRCDLLVDDLVIVEIKATERTAKVHAAQLRSTLKAAGIAVGLLIDFGMETIRDGLERVVQTR